MSGTIAQMAANNQSGTYQVPGGVAIMSAAGGPQSTGFTDSSENQVSVPAPAGGRRRRHHRKTVKKGGRRRKAATRRRKH
jgi:hypothetical protein